jgi:DNA-binding MarR family transcriptional regulator
VTTTSTSPKPAHPRRYLDDLLTHAVRFSIAAALAGVGKAEFALVRDSVEISDSVLSKQAAILEEAGYLAVEKGRVGRMPRTWLSLTPAGEAAYRQHVAALKAIADIA